MSESLSEFLQANPWLNLVFLLLAIAGIVATIFTYLRSRRYKVPVFDSRSFPLLHPAVSRVDDLAVRFKEQDLELLTLSQVAFWNKGLEPIRRADNAPADRIRIELPEDALLVRLNVDFVSSPSNALTLTAEGETVYIDFDYISHLEGIRFDVYHTGPADLPLTVTGTVIGARKLANGYVSENHIIDKVLDPIFQKIPTPKSRLLRIALVPVYMPILVAIFAPVSLLLFPVNVLYRLLYSPPKVFNLLDEKDKGEQDVASNR